MTSVAPDWNKLAAYWHCFEVNGLDKNSLRIFISLLKPPILYVGGGRGTYATYLGNLFGRDKVTVVDSSLSMAQRAYNDFNLQYTVADARNMPFSNNSFASVLCATGVIEFLTPDSCKLALEEMARVCIAEGLLFITVPSLFACCPSRDEENSIFDTNYLLPVPTRMILEEWFKSDGKVTFDDNHKTLQFNMLAREMGGREAAYELLKKSFPPFEYLIYPDAFCNFISQLHLYVDKRIPIKEKGIEVFLLRIKKNSDANLVGH